MALGTAVSFPLQTGQTTSQWEPESTTPITGFGKCEVALHLTSEELAGMLTSLTMGNCHFCLFKGTRLNRPECQCGEYGGGVLQKAHNCPQNQGGWQAYKFIIGLFTVSRVSEDCSSPWGKKGRQVGMGV